MSFNPALLTDFYELTMMQGYFLHQHNPRAVFEMFFRKPPFKGGFSIFAGLQTLLEGLEELQFSTKDLDYLGSLELFVPEFLDYLAGLRFSGDIYAMQEGTAVFPNEPLLRIHAPLIEAQLIESFLLNTINYQTLVATKAARVYLAAKEGLILEMGLRRAHGSNGALAASRAAYIGGAAATSNTLAGRLFDIPVKGTMAHSWIMAFDSEREAFERYAETYPEGCILLIDTYDTLHSGLIHAIEVGKKLKEKGHQNFGVRLDSGDLEYLSKQVRQRLDAAGLTNAKIAVSNELDERIIDQLVSSGAPIDVWGVGTNMVTARDDPSLAGVYKLIARETARGLEPAIKVSDNPGKISNPGLKQVYRFFGKKESPLADLITLEDEKLAPHGSHRFYHPMYSYKHFDIQEYSRFEPLLSIKFQEGRMTYSPPDLEAIRRRTITTLENLDDTFKRLINPHIYKVSLSEKLQQLKFSMIKQYQRERDSD